MKFEIIIGADLTNLGLTECGTPFLAEQYFVIAEDENGNRWKHRATFISSKREEIYHGDDIMVSFPDNRIEAGKAADALAERITTHLENGGKLNKAHWLATFPRYGSTVSEIETFFYSDIEE